MIQLSGEAIHNYNLSWRFLSDSVPFLTRIMCRSRALGPGGTTPAVPGLWTMSLYVDVYLSILFAKLACFDRKLAS